VDVQRIRRKVQQGNFAMRRHALQHATKEGSNQTHVAKVVVNGRVLEEYPDCNRCLFYKDVLVSGVRVPLHAVCEESAPHRPIDVVTAYVPNPPDWVTPTQRGVKRP